MKEKQIEVNPEAERIAKAAYELAKRIVRERREAAESFDKEFGIVVDRNGFGVRHF